MRTPPLNQPSTPRLLSPLPATPIAKFKDSMVSIAELSPWTDWRWGRNSSSEAKGRKEEAVSPTRGRTRSTLTLEGGGEYRLFPKHLGNPCTRSVKPSARGLRGRLGVRARPPRDRRDPPELRRDPSRALSRADLWSPPVPSGILRRRSSQGSSGHIRSLQGPQCNDRRPYKKGKLVFRLTEGR